jgi:hypothetical protein
MKTWMNGCALGLALALGGATVAVAQNPQDRTRLHRHAPLHVNVAPAGQLYRQCADLHVVEHRATGDTVVPRTHCWWALR